MSKSALTAVAEAAAGETHAPAAQQPAPAPAPAPVAAAPTAAAPEAAPATISAADALELLATGYPDMAASITPLATLARAGCDNAAFGKAVLTQVATARAADPALAAATGHRPLGNSAPDNAVPQPGQAEAAEVPSPAEAYAARAAAMAEPARPH